MSEHRPVTWLPPPLHVDRLACSISYDGHPLALIDEAVERAAIIEFDGKVSRERAEAAALRTINPRLRPAPASL